MTNELSASRLLASHWRNGTRLDQLPVEIRPVDRARGYAVQAHIEAQSGSDLYGWKIAATSSAGQAHLAVDGPLAGRLLAERAIEDGGICPFANNHMQAAEVEFAFRMATTLAPREKPYDVDEVVAAVGALHPAIEIPDSRFDAFDRVGAPQIIADNACANFFVEGPAAPDRWREMDLGKLPVTGTVNDRSVAGSGSNVLGDPRIALQWLVNELSKLGLPLRAGQLVMTGTCVSPMKISPGDRVCGDLGPLGSVSVRMAVT